MQVRPAPFLILLLATVTPAIAAAQSTWGAPAEGVQVQSRFSSPGQSQAILTAAPPAAAPAPAAPQAAPAAAAPGAGDGAPQPFLNDRVTVSGDSYGLASGGAGDSEMLPIAATLMYQGVIPGRSPGASGTGKTNALNWIGFQPLDLVTRVFVRTDHEAPFEVITAPDGLSVTVRLKVRGISHRNLSRTIDTSAFGREVAAIDTKRGPDGTTDVVISLLAPARFVTDAREGYLYVDFAR
jgi:hypothetical protein